MDNLDSVFQVVGFLIEAVLLFSGVLIFVGILPISKRVSPKHSANRQAGKGMLILFGAILSFQLAKTYASDWSGWLIFLIDVVCILVMFLGLRIFLEAMKKINMAAQQEVDQTNS